MEVADISNEDVKVVNCDIYVVDRSNYEVNSIKVVFVREAVINVRQHLLIGEVTMVAVSVAVCTV